ncbi:MAG: DUF488 domain-containing protein [Endomicrobium sp.]|jgi:uncharacterized protein (DUF488 family)|nr:DUF488 domain-containing protein [Endomicrobium sp.]
MFYRKKILLNLLNAFGGKLNKISFIKLLFLFSMSDKTHTHPYYEFVPYNYGAFSFTAYSDINGMKREGVIFEDVESKEFLLKYFDRQLYRITDNDSEKIENLYQNFHDKKCEDLIKTTYRLYPYYAQNSKKRKYITKQIQSKIVKIIPDDNKTILFDIGYEGKSLEAYLNLLIKNNIKTLIDVRKNPISMKYGFSKNLLTRITSDLGIEYAHLPELGIESEKRQALSSFEDYQNLFSNYEAKTLKQNTKSIKNIYNIVMKNKKAALTCFEADKNYCHRYRIVNYMSNIYPNEFEVVHL